MRKCRQGSLSLNKTPPGYRGASARSWLPYGIPGCLMWFCAMTVGLRPFCFWLWLHPRDLCLGQSARSHSLASFVYKLSGLAYSSAALSSSVGMMPGLVLVPQHCDRFKWGRRISTECCKIPPCPWLCSLPQHDCFNFPLACHVDAESWRVLC